MPTDDIRRAKAFKYLFLNDFDHEVSLVPLGLNFKYLFAQFFLYIIFRIDGLPVVNHKSILQPGSWSDLIHILLFTTGKTNIGKSNISRGNNNNLFMTFYTSRGNDMREVVEKWINFDDDSGITKIIITNQYGE